MMTGEPYWDRITFVTWGIIAMFLLVSAIRQAYASGKKRGAEEMETEYYGRMRAAERDAFERGRAEGERSGTWAVQNSLKEFLKIK